MDFPRVHGFPKKSMDLQTRFLIWGAFPYTLTKMKNGEIRDGFVRKIANGIERIIESYGVSDEAQEDLKVCVKLIANRTGLRFEWSLAMYQRTALVHVRSGIVVPRSTPEPQSSDELSHCDDDAYDDKDGENVPRPHLTASSVHLIVLETDENKWTWALGRFFFCEPTSASFVLGCRATLLLMRTHTSGKRTSNGWRLTTPTLAFGAIFMKTPTRKKNGKAAGARYNL